EISPDVLNRESIGSLSNCIACHTTAEDGIYDDDNVKIPK
ncbi:MAG: diheme cytochrome c, partial [Proteobacteria bacterium]|nr:diheme cytochrome c [Pseudomonadota bacterium]